MMNTSTDREVHPLLIGWEQEEDFSPIVQDRTNEDKGMACDFFRETSSFFCRRVVSLFFFFFSFSQVCFNVFGDGMTKSARRGFEIGNHHRCDKWGFEGCCMDGPYRNMWVRGPGIKEGSGGALTHFIYFY